MAAKKTKPVCNKCGLPIRWEKNAHERWVPYNVKGDKVHWETCPGQPATDTKLQLKERIKELEEKVQKQTWTIQGYAHREQEHRRRETEETLYNAYLGTPVQSLLHAAKAWESAHATRPDRVEYHTKRLLRAVGRLREAEQAKKKRKS